MPYSIKGDIHTHTLYSRHAYSTIQENVAAAAEAGLDLFGSADHFSAMLHPEQDIRNFQFFLNTEIWPRQWMGVTLLRGAEVDIVSVHGDLFGQDIPVPASIVGRRFARELSLFERATGSLDYLVASVHNAEFAEGATLAATTEMYLSVLDNPRVMVLGHTGRSGVPYELDEVLLHAKELGKLIEINEHSLDHGEKLAREGGICRRIAERCAELGVGICVNSDAHISTQVGKYPRVEHMLEQIHFPEELIMNRDARTFLTALDAAGMPVVE